MSHLFVTDNVLESLHLNYPVVYECYSQIKIKCFTYHPSCTNWNEIITWHKTRHPRPIFSWGDVREVNHISNFLDSHYFTSVPKQLMKCGVSPDKIIYIGNHHAMVDQQDVHQHISKHMSSIFLRYFELDAVLRHNPIYDTRKNWQGPLTQPNIKPSKKYLCMFGKPRKFMRIGAMIKMIEHSMHHDALISSLAEKQGIDHSTEWASQYWPKEQVHQTLTQFQGSLDKVNYDAPETADSNYRGYPYDEKLYQNTLMSIIAETNDIPIDKIPTLSQFFITEKTARTIYNKHPFIMLSTVNFLQKLRDLGYQTFNTIIDESYDIEKDPYQRLEMALTSARELCLHASSTQVKQICKHNFNHLHTVYALEHSRFINLLLYLSSK